MSGAGLGAPAIGEPTHLEEWVRLKAVMWSPFSISGMDEELGMSTRETERPRPGPNILVLRTNENILLWKTVSFMGNKTKQNKTSDA
jgi:hypothetical protein